MPQTMQFDLQTLRRRIGSATGLPPTGALVRASQLPAPRRRDRSRPAVEGETRSGPLGQFILQQHLLANRQFHGSMRVELLQGFEADWPASISTGEVPATDPRRWAFLDTETTGLAGGTGTCAFLVGIGAIEDEGFRVRLFFMRDFDEEAAMLQAIGEFLRRFDVLVTYNGKCFDAPLLETRFRLKRQHNPIARMRHLDLLHPARRLWKERLPSCGLGTVESEILGVERHGDVPGALIPRRYFDFVRTGRSAPLKPVFRHNVIDIVSLACLGRLLLPVFADPESANLRHGTELLGLARWLAQQGELERGLGLYHKAIRAGLPSERLFDAVWESARLERRTGNFAAQVRLLQDLSRVANVHRAAAYVELAKHYEHRRKNLDRALEMTRNAQQHAPSDDLAHRERRLLRKIGYAAAVAAPAA